jgi:alpha-N-arabinofuranosidase
MILRSNFRLTFLLSWIAVTLSPPLVAQQTATIDISASQVLAPVNHLIFGHNINAADNAYIFSSNTTDVNLIQTGEGFWDPVKAAPVPQVLNQSKAVGMGMLRYPGGCYVHNFDWRKAVGPDAKKSGWLFGLDEYLTLCHDIGAVPLIIVSDYALPADQMPQNAAALVEYLNSPADPAHPWAIKRKEYGHPEPYNVTWFELGNESIHGNHRVLPRREYTAEAYAAYANATAAAMRKVDPRVKLGIVMVPGALNDIDSDWNRTVVRLAGSSANFVVIHAYAPQEPKAGIPENILLQSMMAAPDQIGEDLLAYHKMIREQLGHDLPLGVTEFNGGLDQSVKPYRFSYGNALECADLLRVFLEPEVNVALANYFNFINGYYGIVRTAIHGQQPSVEPPFSLYELWEQHFGSKLLKVEVQAPRAEFPGAGSLVAAYGKVPEPRRQIQSVDLNQPGPPTASLPNVQMQRQNSNLTVRLRNLNRGFYPLIARIARPTMDKGTQIEFSVSFDGEFIPDPGSDTADMGIGLMDTRGWAATLSGIGVDGITTGWKHFDGTYRLDPLTQSVDLSIRLVADGKNVSGTLQLRNLEVTEFTAAHDAAYSLLTSSASASSDGRKLYLIVFNKSVSDSIQTSIRLAGFSAAAAQYWEANGPSLDATSGIETKQSAVEPITDPKAFTHDFPPHSMTAIELSASR